MRFFSALLAVLVAVAFASPLTSSLAHCAPPVTAECSDAGCTDSGCESSPDGCAHCGHFGKMLAFSEPRSIGTRAAGSLDLSAPAKVLPDGFLPVIDQPPRAA
ncbi:MAG: hypothetical protein SFU53_02565 [Terrimicrobiaceae bacterium]|nr:hypothetical protein [Terrimicrobiaceae bacterium]